jgi:hypothetical protein
MLLSLESFCLVMLVCEYLSRSLSYSSLKVPAFLHSRALRAFGVYFIACQSSLPDQDRHRRREKQDAELSFQVDFLAILVHEKLSMSRSKEPMRAHLHCSAWHLWHW